MSVEYRIRLVCRHDPCPWPGHIDRAGKPVAFAIDADERDDALRGLRASVQDTHDAVLEGREVGPWQSAGNLEEEL